MERVLGMVSQIAKATTEQNKEIQLIVKATGRITDVTNHVRVATNEQSSNSKQISQAIELVSDKSQQISRAVKEQEVGAGHILAAIEKIKDLPRENRARAFALNQLVKELLKDSELTVTEMSSFTFSRESASGVLRLGIVPLESPAVMFRRFAPLAEHLGSVLKRRIDLKVAVDFAGAIEDLGKGETQFCFMTPSTYIEAHKKFGARVLVKLLREGKPFQHSVIVTGAGSGIRSVADIRGHSFAFGDPHSTSSHIVPRAMLLEEGIDVKDLLYFNYLGHHDDVAKAVLNGDFDAGGIMESTAEKFRESGLESLKYSGEIPEFNICVSPEFDPGLQAELSRALISIESETPEGDRLLKAINETYTGFTEAADADYDVVRKMMSDLGML
jgi:phosphonate transport system substrate-binding protein